MTASLDGVLFEPMPGSAVSAEEFLQARSLLTEVHQAMAWSPWVLQDRAREYAAAWQVIGQWRRCEPDVHPLTVEEAEAALEQRLAEAEASFEAEQRQAESDRAERAASYDPERAEARLALLEERAILADRVSAREEVEQSAGWRSEKQCQALAASLDREIAGLEQEIERLARLVGDEETVVDVVGWLPAERREMALSLFKTHRIEEVHKLRTRVTARRTELKATTGKADRTRVREALRRDTCRLEYLEAIPPMAAADMCSECATPAKWHAVPTTYGLSGEGEISGPCDAWPRRASTLRTFRQELTELISQPIATPPPPPPQPLAVIAADVPVEELTAQLTAIQAQHPGAIVRQGRRKRWEVWPGDQTQD